ncbi:MAG: class I SAM-dependent methyltransferase [Armatimonadetes bacterium]|nr:class I SAM-dependent methyltransferase [Armatimonadota bacterium]
MVHLSLADSAYFQELGSGLKVYGDVRRLPLEDGAFSHVVISGLPTDVARPALEELCRVTEPGGFILIADRDPAWADAAASHCRTSLEEVPLPGLSHGFHLFRVSGGEALRGR